MRPYNRYMIDRRDGGHMTGERAEIFETYRSSFRMLISTMTFLTTADVTFIGYAMSNKSAMLIFVASLFPIMSLVVLFMFSRIFGAIFFSGMRISESEGDAASLFFSSSLLLAKPKLYHELKSIAELDDTYKQLNRLLLVKNKFIPPFSLTITLVVALLQTCGSLLLWHFFGWSFP